MLTNDMLPFSVRANVVSVQLLNGSSEEFVTRFVDLARSFDHKPLSDFVQALTESMDHSSDPCATWISGLKRVMVKCFVCSVTKVSASEREAVFYYAERIRKQEKDFGKFQQAMAQYGLKEMKSSGGDHLADMRLQLYGDVAPFRPLEFSADFDSSRLLKAYNCSVIFELLRQCHYIQFTFTAACSGELYGHLLSSQMLGFRPYRIHCACHQGVWRLSWRVDSVEMAKSLPSKVMKRLWQELLLSIPWWQAESLEASFEGSGGFKQQHFRSPKRGILSLQAQQLSLCAAASDVFDPPSQMDQKYAFLMDYALLYKGSFDWYVESNPHCLREYAKDTDVQWLFFGEGMMRWRNSSSRTILLDIFFSWQQDLCLDCISYIRHVKINDDICLVVPQSFMEGKATGPQLQAFVKDGGRVHICTYALKPTVADLDRVLGGLK